MQKILIIKIQKELEKIKMRYKSRYGAAFFDVKIKNLGGGIFLEGIVLTARQKKETFLAVQEILKDIKFKNKIKVLGEPKENLEIGWGIVKSDIADIWGIFPGKKKHNIISAANSGCNQATCGERNPAIYGEQSRATQAVKSDAMRILAQKGTYYLAQARDLTIGWINKHQVSSIKHQAKRKKRFAAKRPKNGELLNVNLTNKIRNKFIDFLKKYLYVPYVRGGATELGIDCSGLVQKFYWEIFEILLPRHSADQAGYGEKASLGSARFGDLVFLRRKIKKYSHIGIIIEADQRLLNGKLAGQAKTKNQKIGNFLILNARREKDGVAIQSAEEVLKDYNLISVKRIISFC